ncbi:MAG: outer membrane protein transport protein [Alphaproteobacteria bacterium]
MAFAALLTGLASAPAQATDGYFQYGYGARQKALGGAGVADSRDATAASLNPAGLVDVTDQVDFSATLFSPRREMTGGPGPRFTPEGTVESNRNYFAIPNFAWSKHLNSNMFFDVAAISVYGNGGMNTSYPAVSRSFAECGGGSGVFCGGKMGVDLQQMFISLALAKRIAPNMSVGVAPIIARQQIKLKGLGAFAPMSSDPANLTGNGYDESWGAGIRVGFQWAITPNIRLGVAGNSRVYMQEFEKYSGLFAEQGDFDIPASIQGGIAIDLKPNLTFMADYKYINYSSIKSISNPSTNAAPLGDDNGPGFGWNDVNIFKFGLEWRATHDMTFRVGYSHTDNPIQSRDVMFNVIAPGVVQDHFTGGAEFQLSENLALELAGAYVPEVSVKGIEQNGTNHPVEISMDQFEVTAGIKYRLSNPVEPLK